MENGQKWGFNGLIFTRMIINKYLTMSVEAFFFVLKMQI